MVRIAKVVPVGGDDVVVVSHLHRASFMPTRSGRHLVRLLAPRDVLDLVEEWSLGDHQIVVVQSLGPKKPRRAPTIVGVAPSANLRRIDAPSKETSKDVERPNQQEAPEGRRA